MAWAWGASLSALSRAVTPLVTEQPKSVSHLLRTGSARTLRAFGATRDRPSILPGCARGTEGRLRCLSSPLLPATPRAWFLSAGGAAAARRAPAGARRLGSLLRGALPPPPAAEGAAPRFRVPPFSLAGPARTPASARSVRRFSRVFLWPGCQVVVVAVQHTVRPLSRCLFIGLRC